MLLSLKSGSQERKERKSRCTPVLQWLFLSPLPVNAKTPVFEAKAVVARGAKAILNHNQSPEQWGLGFCTRVATRGPLFTDD